MFTIFFSGEKLAFLDSLPKGQNGDSYYLCNTVLERTKVGAIAGARKATLRDFHRRTDNCRVHNSKLTKEKLDELRLIRWDHPTCAPDIAPSDFGFSGGAKAKRKDMPSRVERQSKHSYSKSGQEWILVNFSVYVTNE
jgi:hypothetical protein